MDKNLNNALHGSMNHRKGSIQRTRRASNYIDDDDNESTTNNGIVDYNDSSTSTNPVDLIANVWTDVPNDGAGAFSNFNFMPEGVTRLMDVTTGRFDFSELSLGDNILIRNDITIIPDTNNALLELRYRLGVNQYEYTLEKLVSRLDSGSNIPYRFSLQPDMVYLGDDNTRNSPVILQVRLSTEGKLINAGTAIGVVRK